MAEHQSPKEGRTATMSLEEKTVLAIEPGELKVAFRKMAPFMSEEETRFYLCGIYMKFDGEKLTFCATNGHILCEIVREANVQEDGEFELIIPATAVKHLTKILPTTKQTPFILMKVTEGSNEVELDSQDFQYNFKTIDGQFPDYTRLIPAGTTKMREGVRAGYLMNILKALGDHPVDMSVDDPDKAFSAPHLLTADASAGIRCVIMPMRVDRDGDEQTDEAFDQPEEEFEAEPDLGSPTPELVTDKAKFPDNEEELYAKAVELVQETGRATGSTVQRGLKIGYNRAARFIERMEAEDIVSPANATGQRKVL